MDATMSQSAAARAYEPDPSGQDEASAGDRIVPRREPIPDPPADGQALEEALSNDRRTQDDQARARAYQDLGLRALAYLDHLAAAVSTAASTMRWNSHDPATIGVALSSVRANLDAAQAAIDARVAIVTGEVAIERDLKPKEQPAPAAEPEPETWLPLPAEGYLVAATRSLEAVRSHAEQALMGFQFAPREAGMIFGVLDAIQEQAEAAQRHYLDFTLAQDAEARAR